MYDINGKTVSEVNCMFPKGYQVTGRLVRGGRFSHHYSNICVALAINLWNGSVWGVKADGKRKLLKRVYN